MESSRRALLRTGAAALAVLGPGCAGGPNEVKERPETQTPGGWGPEGQEVKTRTGETKADVPDALAPLDAGGVGVLRPPGDGAVLATEGCGPEPALTPEERALARTVGDVLRGFDVAPQYVQTTPHCQCLDAGRLALGHAEPTADREELRRAVSGTGNGHLVVGTGEVIKDAIGISLDRGELATFDPSGRPRGRVPPARWSVFADRVRAPIAGRGAYAIPVGSGVPTLVHRFRSGRDGRTVFVIAGMHGDEAAGYRAARRIAKWTVKAGTLVVLPTANRRAVARKTRTGPDGHDLNRRFLLDRPATSGLARAIWDAVVRHDPDIVVDLHSSRGIYDSDINGVGQAVFHSHDHQATQWANRLVSHLDESVLPADRRPEYEYTANPLSRVREGMLVTRVTERLGVPTFLHEVTEYDVDTATTTDWTVAFVAKLLSLAGLSNNGSVATSN